MKRFAALVGIATVLGCASAREDGLLAHAGAPPAASGPCSSAEFRQMDFWIGVWDVSWEASSGQAAGAGVNTITRQLDGCVIQEAFEGGPSTNGLVGHSVSTFHAGPGLWRQTWVDNQGGYFALTGGPSENGAFVLNNTRLRDSAPHRRMVFEDIQANSLTWRWQGSADGETWSDMWVIRYTRRSSSFSP